MYNFKEREEHWRKFWEKEKIYQFNPESKKPFFSVDTPPPYVSAEHLHQGHIMSYSQAEFIVRFKRMKGFEVFYPMGFDDNGLPTERFVEKKYNVDKGSIKRDEFVKLCLKETKTGSGVYKNLWQLLGISVDWTKTYSTISKRAQKVSQWSFIDLFQKGKVLRKEEPVSWCTFCQTALAQADLEDKEDETFLNYIDFENGLVIATTRPELLPACSALFFNPSDKRYVFLKGKKAVVPLFSQKVPILSDKKVDKDYGTGLMMVCTWGDQEDVRRWKEHNLETRVVVNPDGTLTSLAKEFKGMKIEEGRKRIIEKLEKKGLLKKQEIQERNIPVHERCSTPIDFIKTKQWFIDILSSKEKFLKQADKMKWYPLSMKQRYIDWVKALKWDWCISRQRYYGVPFPLWYCKKCNQVLLAKELPVDPTVDKPKEKCSCGSEEFIPEKDVMDTWATSSLTVNIADELAGIKLYPFSLRPQAFEIIRTWLFYTVVKSLYHFNSIPFSNIMIAGHGLDEKGRKISKRLGNYVPPEKIVENYGADALRYWATGAKLGTNLKWSEKEVKKGKRTVIKIFNAANFCFSHFEKKDYSKLKGDLKTEDKWILYHLNKTVKKVNKYFENYSYSKSRDEIDNFFWNYFTSNYLEFVKYRLYGKKDETAKRVLYQCLLNIIKMYAPLLPFITEEVYQQYFRKFEKVKSIHLASFPEEKKISFKEKEEFKKVLKVIEEVRKYKSDNKISLGKEIPQFETKTKFNKKYTDFIRQTTRVKTLK